MSDETTREQTKEQTQQEFENVLRRMLKTPPAPRKKAKQTPSEDTPEGSKELDSEGS